MNKKTKNQLYKSAQFLELDHQYQLLGTSIFEWEGLTDLDIPVYEPENTLYKQGQACMLQIPGTDSYAILPVAYGSEKLDIYGRPTEWRAYCVGDSPIADRIRNTRLSATGSQGTQPSVLIWNDYTRMPSQKYVRLMLAKMVNVDIALESNINIQKTPILINCNQTNLLTAKNFYNAIMENEGVFKSNDMEDMSIDVLNLGVQFIGAELSDQYKTFENRILEYFGINNLPVEKQERMLTGEVSSNDDKTGLMFESRLLMRERACEEMKDIFGLDITVKQRELSQTNTSDMYGTQQFGGSDRDAGEEGRPERQQD